MTFITVSAIFFLDQLSKFFASKNLLLNQSVPAINGFLYFTLVHNKGAAFGMLKNQTPLFIITSVIAITLIYLNLKKDKQKRFLLYRFSLSLIASGALGNLVDRLFFGYVIDFIDFRIWPVFNIADSAITIGAILLAYAILKKPETSPSTTLGTGTKAKSKCQ